MENRVEEYLNEVTQLHCNGAISLVSVILFGSAATGAITQSSDVDLILVVPDGTSRHEWRRLRDQVTMLEVRHGFRVPIALPLKSLKSFAERAAGHAHCCFVCSQGDFISGDIARIFGLGGSEAIFVERMFLASVIASARTVWGEELLRLVPLLPLRRIDVFKSLFRSTAFTLFCVAGFPLLPDATRYAMSTLKHALHSCYFCYRTKTVSFEEEVAFFNASMGRDQTLQELAQQRKEYRRSFAFVLLCVPTLFRLHLRTVRDNRFPRAVARPQSSA